MNPRATADSIRAQGTNQPMTENHMDDTRSAAIAEEIRGMTPNNAHLGGWR